MESGWSREKELNPVQNLLKTEVIPTDSAIAPRERFWHVNKQFLPIKVAYFWFYAGLIAMLPLLTVHMKQLGLNMHDVAQIYLLLPFFSCIGPPVIGYIADRTGHIRRCFVLTVVLNTILHHALLLVPPSKHTLSLTSRETAFRLNRSCQSDWSSGRISQWLSHPNISRPNLLCATSCVNTTEKTITPEVAIISIVGNSSSFQQQLGTSWLHSGNASSVGNALCEGRGADCWVSCQMTVEGLQSSRVTFWTYALLRLAGCFFLAPSLTLIDATTVALTKQHRIRGQNYGRQRSMGLVASIIFPPITGALVDVVSTPDYRDYSPCFYIMDICVTLSIASFLVFNIRISLPEKTSFRKVLKVLRQVEVQAFVFFIIILGMMWGFLEAFLFVFLIELNAPTCLLGLTLTVAGLASLPFTWYSEIICDKLGYINILIISFFGYTARYLGYSLIRQGTRNISGGLPGEFDRFQRDVPGDGWTGSGGRNHLPNPALQLPQ